MILTKEMVAGLVSTGASARADDDIPPRFQPGDRIRAKNLNPFGHTRLPRYIRGKEGTVDRCHGVFVFPDTAAHHAGEKPQNVYSVRFEATELWGDVAGKEAVYIDLWDDYIDPA